MPSRYRSVVRSFSARTEGYFAELLAELGRRGARGNAEDAAVRDKRQAIERERAAKLEALVACSTFRLEARPISVALVEAAAYAVPVTLRRRKESREVTLEYDCATRSLVSVGGSFTTVNGEPTSYFTRISK